MIIVHHLNHSRSQRILWLLEELGLEYEIKHYARDPETQLAPESLKKIHPLGKSPVISDGELTLAESGAIIEYLANRYGRDSMLPAAEDPAYVQYLYWLHYAEGSLMPLLVMLLVFDKVKSSPMPFFVKPVARGIADAVKKSYLGPNLKTHLDYIEAHLGQHAWFAGEKFSAADIQMSFPLEAALAGGTIEGNYPRIKAYVKKLHAMPGYQQALKAGGPYAYA